MRKLIQEKVDQCQAEIQTLNRTKQELNEGHSKLVDIIKKLERDEADLKKDLQLLKEKDEELTKTLYFCLEKSDEIDIHSKIFFLA